jgi:hypothetical protein
MSGEELLEGALQNSVSRANCGFNSWFAFPPPVRDLRRGDASCAFRHFEFLRPLTQPLPGAVSAPAMRLRGGRLICIKTSLALCGWHMFEEEAQ